MVDKVTCCPHCNTSFRITDAQLASAKGAVRCGSCLQIFKAVDHLIEQEPVEFDSFDSDTLETAVDDAEYSSLQETDLAPKESATPEDSHPHKPNDEFNINDLEDHELAVPTTDNPTSGADDLDFSELTPAPTEQENELISDDMHDTPEFTLSAEFLDQDETPQTHGSLFDRNIQSKQQVTDSTDDSWAEALLDEPTTDEIASEEPELHPSQNKHNGDDERKEPRFVITGEDPIDTGNTPKETDSLFDEEPLSSLEDDKYFQADTPPESLTDTENNDSETQEILRGIANAPVEMEWRDRRSVWPKRFLWSGLCLIPLVLLGAQISWLKFDTLSRIEPYRSLYQLACPVIGCDVPKKYNLALIKSYNLVVRSHPKAQEALAIDSILLNTASFSQPFPHLMLVFSDLNGDPVAHRTFAPSEYLAGELAGINKMPTQQPVHISLEIIDPGAKAVNYQLAIVEN